MTIIKFTKPKPGKIGLKVIAHEEIKNGERIIEVDVDPKRVNQKMVKKFIQDATDAVAKCSFKFNGYMPDGKDYSARRDISREFFSSKNEIGDKNVENLASYCFDAGFFRGLAWAKHKYGIKK